jgi:putative membrane protein
MFTLRMRGQNNNRNGRLMKRILTNKERNLLEKRIATAEKHTGAQIVLAVIERCDSYAEIPWKAFALGAAVAGFLVFIVDLFFSQWCSDTLVLIAVVSMLVTGILAAILSLYVPKFARFFLVTHRAEVEVRQYAESLFLSRELFATRRRTGVLLLVSLFERRIVLLPDKGLNRRLNQKAMQKIITQMRPSLISDKVALALEKGLVSLEEILSKKKRGKSRKNELSNYIIEEAGV